VFGAGEAEVVEEEGITIPTAGGAHRDGPWCQDTWAVLVGAAAAGYLLQYGAGLHATGSAATGSIESGHIAASLIAANLIATDLIATRCGSFGSGGCFV
jgi:hypothetical protein